MPYGATTTTIAALATRSARLITAVARAVEKAVAKVLPWRDATTTKTQRRRRRAVVTRAASPANISAIEPGSGTADASASICIPKLRGTAVV